MPKTFSKVLRVFLVGHLLPVTLFAFTVFMASAVVTACSPGRGSTLRDGSPAAAQTDLKASTPSIPPVQTDLEKKLSGSWQCVEPKDADTPCFGQNLVFSDFLDKMNENTFISLDDSKGKCHVDISYSLSAETDKTGNVTLHLGSATLGDLIKDPSNDEECEDDFKNSQIPNLSRHQLLAHSDDWKQITLDGVTYSRPDPSKADPSKANPAEAWPSP